MQQTFSIVGNRMVTPSFKPADFYLPVKKDSISEHIERIFIAKPEIEGFISNLGLLKESSCLIRQQDQEEKVKVPLGFNH